MIAVTGATGLLGSYVVRKLLQDKIPFVALKRTSSDMVLVNDIAAEINWHEADVNDYDSLLAAFSNVTGVIHAAAVVSYHKRDRENLNYVNIVGTANVVNACLQLSIKRLLHVSSVAALGKQKNNQVLDENSKWIDGAINSQYAISKYKAELEVWRGQEEGLQTVIVNPSVILAPTNWNNSSAQLFKYAWQQRPFYTQGSFSAVDVRDVASCIVKLYQSTIEAERFIINSEAITYLKFFQLAAKHFQKKPPTILVGKKLLQVAAIFESIRGLLTGSNPLVTKETAQLAGRAFTYKNEKIKRAIDIDFQSVEDSIGWCCSEYAKKLPIKK
jgi:dihydroflavonol-4-reductase